VPRDRRDIAKKSSPALLILIVAGVALLGLCVCGAPIVLFLGFMPVALVREERRAAEVERDAVDQMARAEEAMKAEVMKAEEAKAARGLAKGVAGANDAIAKDKLLLKEYPPLPAPGWHGEYVKLLKERCKCDYQVIAGKLAKEQEDEIKGWNETIQAELRRRHGEMIIADLQKEAEQRWRARIKGKGNK
jgi:hypothetical protein